MRKENRNIMPETDPKPAFPVRILLLSCPIASVLPSYNLQFLHNPKEGILYLLKMNITKSLK